MKYTGRNALALLLVFALCTLPGVTIVAGAIEPQTKTEDFGEGLEQMEKDWDSNDAGTRQIADDEGNNVLQFYGGGKNKFNKIYTSAAYVGDVTLSFDVLFRSEDKTEVLYFTPRYNNPQSESASHFESPNYYATVVLYTGATSGLRLAQNNSSKLIDSSISENAWQKTDMWYSMIYEIKGDTHSIKLWPREESEPDEWTLTGSFPDAPISGAMSIAKQGVGDLYLDNISIQYLYGSENPIAYSVASTAPIEVPCGTPFEALNLPETLSVTFTDGLAHDINVNWNSDDYQGNTNGTYTITGTLALTEEQNAQALMAEIEVTVIPVAASSDTYCVWSAGEIENILALHQFGLARTNQGTLLAFAEARIVGRDADEPHHIVLKRSEDGGQTWGETILVGDYRENQCKEDENLKNGESGHCYANPTPVVDKETGRIFVFYAENMSNESTRLFYKYSDDDAHTWSDATEVTHLFDDDRYGRVVHLPGPGHGLQIENGAHSGRLVMEVWHRQGLDLEDRQYGLSVLFSDDNGITWENSEYMLVGFGMNEGRIAQLADGTLVVNSRSRDSTRKHCYSTDGGETWATPKTWTSIGSYKDCDSGFISSTEGGLTRLLTVHPVTDIRNNLTVYLSYDGGVTWPYSKEIWNDPDVSKGTGASDMCVLPERSYGVLHGTHLTDSSVEFVVLNLEWLTGLDDETEVSHEHYGGTATCITKAICQVCGDSYGEFGPHDICSSCDKCTLCAEVNGGRCSGHSSGSSTTTFSIELASQPENGTVKLNSTRAERGDRVTITTVPDEGYVARTVTVLDKAGKALDVTDNGDGTHRFTMPGSKVSVAVTFTKEIPDLWFSDVAAGDWYYDGVLYVNERGLMVGVGDNLFGANTTVTRAMLATILYQLEDEPAITVSNPFADVADDVWYADGVIWASAKGIVSGVGNDKFAPNSAITREEMALMLCNYAQYKGYDVSKRGDLTPFSDGWKTSVWALDALKWANGEGLISGKGNNIIDPTGPANRAEIATILMGFMEDIE